MTCFNSIELRKSEASALLPILEAVKAELSESGGQRIRLGGDIIELTVRQETEFRRAVRKISAGMGR
jgi:hypothetical protein